MLRGGLVSLAGRLAAGGVPRAQAPSCLSQCRASHSKIFVTLNNDVPGLGYSGEEAEVSRGYARNFLVPRGLARIVPLVRGLRRARLAKQKSPEEAQAATGPEAEEKRMADMLRGYLSRKPLSFKRQMGKDGRTFQSTVAPEHVAKYLREKAKFEVDAGDVRVPEIKEPGEYEGGIRIGGEEFPVTLFVEAR
eukprot:tig00000169_g11880.t1